MLASTRKLIAVRSERACNNVRLPAFQTWHRELACGIPMAPSSLSGAAYTSFRSALLQLYSMLHTVFNVNITVVVYRFLLWLAHRALEQDGSGLVSNPKILDDQ